MFKNKSTFLYFQYAFMILLIICALQYLLATNPHMKSSICVFYIQMHHGYYSLQLFMYFDSFLICRKNPVHPKNNLMFNIFSCRLHSADEWIKDVQTARYHYKFTIIKDVLILQTTLRRFIKKDDRRNLYHT
jgi:hypothetical protein